MTALTQFAECRRLSWVNAQQASGQSLAYDNSVGNAIIKVDNTTTVVWDNKRNSVRISTKDTYTVGSVWIADVLHARYEVVTLAAIVRFNLASS